MKSLKYRLKKHEVNITNTDWNKYDDRLMKAVERVEVDKVASILSKKGIIPTKLDVEGRSAFHLAATRGHLDCLNLMLAHNADTTATDATGKNALHLASRNGHSLCVQKLLQHNCPVGNVDLQGRTALHDAVMAGCAFSVKLLCDSGASVNTSDFDGRTPLVLATQMCHPRICQLLLERGADITLRDKQNKTALILGCEYGCRDAVEILLMCGADVTAVDCFSHDPYHYARLNKNQELAVLVKTYLDNVNRAKEATKIEQRKRQQSVESEAAEANKRDQIIHDLERQNESQQEGLRMFHQEQRALLDNVNLLQQQLAQEKLTVETIHKEREQLKLLLSVKEREEGIRSPETVKVQLRSTLGDYSGQSVIKGKENVLVKQSHSLDSAQILQSPTSACSVVRPAETTQPSTARDTSGEVDALRRELEAARKRQRAGEDEAARLQSALARKSQECQELSQSRESAQRQADQQVQDLEDALGDVQKRMLDSECKVKQLQAHVVAVKEHLGGQATDELRAQLQDVKAKYEGASAEVCRVRNRLKQSEKALEEYKSSEGQLAAEVERLGHELDALSGERDQLGSALLEVEQRLKEAKQGAVVPAEKFDNMKNLLTNAVDEKERQLAELREDYDRVLEEVADLHRRQDDRSSQGAREKALEEQNSSLKRKLADVLAKRQALIQDVEDTEEEKEILREQLDELKSRMEVGFVPLAEHEEARRSMIKAMGELEDQLVDTSERCDRAEAQVSHLQAERASLCDNVAALRSAGMEQRCEADTLASQNAALAKELEEARGRCDDREREAARLSAQCESLEDRLAGELVSRRQQEQAKGELAGALESSEARLRHLESREQERSKELKKVLEGSDKLKERLEEVLSEMERDHVSLKEHEAVKVELSAAVAEGESRAKEASAMYASAKEETARLNQELEAQKKELDTIQEAIQSRFVPLTAVAERESVHEGQLKALAARLADAEGRCEAEKAEAERGRREAERLTAEVESVRQALESISGEKRREAEQEHKDQLEELTLKLVDLEQQYKEVTVQRAELEERNALCAVETRGLQQRLDAELARLDDCEQENRSLEDAARQAQAECAAARDARLEEAQRRTELQGVHAEQGALLQQHVQAKEVLQAEVSALQAEVSALRLALEESSGRRQESGQDVFALQAELLQASQALEELRLKEAQAGVLQAEKRRLEEELAGVGGRLLLLAQECQKLQREAEEARAGKDGAKKELENVQQRGHAVEREIRELKERYDDSLCTIGSLQKRIQTSSELTEVKDKKITELLTDVERLKQALNGLSQLAYAGSAPNKRQTQHIDTLQAQIKGLQQQLADAERQHREVVSIYRTHLLSAAQGHMDEDVQAALLQIIRMRQEFVC